MPSPVTKTQALGREMGNLLGPLKTRSLPDREHTFANEQILKQKLSLIIFKEILSKLLNTIQTIFLFFT